MRFEVADNPEMPICKFMVVMEVETVTKDSTYRSKSETTTQRYFKDFDKADGVIKLLGILKENEKIERIFVVSEYGNVFHKTVAFLDGKLQLVDTEEEN